MTEPEEQKVGVGDEAVTAIHYAPAAEARARLILAHGAGANQRHPFMVRTARALAGMGVGVTTFNFGYTERGRRVPDPKDALERCFRQVLHAEAPRGPEVRGLPRPTFNAAPIFLGGKSMGGRIASQVVAAGGLEVEVRGLVFLGYPLHPPKKPTQLRVAHWPEVKVPQLFVQGTRDEFGTVEEITVHVPKLGAPATIFPIEQGDHSFAVPKKLGIPQDEVFTRAFEAMAAWMLARV
ncbi:alpha/beta hydrolase [Pendulispora brunnea]|uniref:Alpha/beta hydrolase n=1 Tax=Pendulispora brunnea TaxID=2905690 RepID=A0ABZ2K7G8_9BACT